MELPEPDLLPHVYVGGIMQTTHARYVIPTDLAERLGPYLPEIRELIRQFNRTHNAVQAYKISKRIRELTKTALGKPEQ